MNSCRFKFKLIDRKVEEHYHSKVILNPSFGELKGSKFNRKLTRSGRNTTTCVATARHLQKQKQTSAGNGVYFQNQAPCASNRHDGVPSPTNILDKASLSGNEQMDSVQQKLWKKWIKVIMWNECCFQFVSQMGHPRYLFGSPFPKFRKRTDGRVGPS